MITNTSYYSKGDSVLVTIPIGNKTDRKAYRELFQLVRSTMFESPDDQESDDHARTAAYIAEVLKAVKRTYKGCTISHITTSEIDLAPTVTVARENQFEPKKAEILNEGGPL